MASSPECITWMVVGLTESVAIITLNSLTVIAFCRDRNLRKRSTYLVINLTVADMISGGTSTLDLFYNVGAICNFWRYNRLSWYQIPQVLHLFGSQPRHHGAANRERKLTVTLFTATSLSLVLWLPYVITSSLYLATDIFSSLSEMVLFRLQGGSMVLLYANSFLNPILYSMRIPDFRRALKILCRQRPQQHRQVQNFPLREINPQNWI